MNYTCTICNKHFLDKASYIKHLKNNYFDIRYKELFISECEKEIPENRSYVKILDITYAHGRRYYNIYNPKCEHKSFMRFDGLLTRDCSHPDCIHKTRSSSVKGKPKSAEHARKIREYNQDPLIREKMSNKLKQVLNEPTKRKKHLDSIKNIDNRYKHLLGVAENQRKKAVKSEEYFKTLLQNYGLRYEHQKVIMFDDFGAIIDFYIPSKNYYICINTDPFHNFNEASTSEKYIKRAKYTIEKDLELKKMFDLDKSLGKLAQIHDTKDMDPFIKNILLKA